MALEIDISNNPLGLSLPKAYCLYELFLDKINKGGSLRLSFWADAQARLDRKKPLFQTNIIIFDKENINADGVIERIKYGNIVIKSPTEIYNYLKLHKIYLDMDKEYIIDLTTAKDLI